MFEWRRLAVRPLLRGGGRRRGERENGGEAEGEEGEHTKAWKEWRAIYQLAMYAMAERHYMRSPQSSRAAENELPEVGGTEKSKFGDSTCAAFRLSKPLKEHMCLSNCNPLLQHLLAWESIRLPQPTA